MPKVNLLLLVGKDGQLAYFILLTPNYVKELVKKSFNPI